MKKLLLLLLLLSPGVAKAATNAAASASLAHVQTAVDASSDGDTVTIPNGSATWSGGITTTKQIIIRALNYTATPAGMVGAGATTRNVTLANSSSSAPLFSFTTGNSYHCGVAGIAFTMNGSSTKAHVLIAGSGTKIGLVQDCYFSHVTRFSPSQGAIVWTALGGLMWNCYADAPGATAASGGPGTDGAGFLINSPRSFSTASTMGMLDSTGLVNVYIEDCTFVNLGQWPDSDKAGRVVVRYSRLNGTWGVTHGFTSGAGNMGRHIEYYNNRFETTDTSGRNMAARYVWVRGGTALLTDNTAVMAANTSQYAGGSVDQLTVGDNTNPGSYPQAGQPGWGHNGSTDVLDPMYVWNQSGNEAYSFHFDGNAGWDGIVLQNREYYLNNGAKPGYVKYTYPHPLRAGGGGADVTAPTISATNVNSITATSLIVHWETSEATTNALDYGTTAAYGTTLTQSEAASFDQSVTGLGASTLYYFRIRSGDAAGNKSTNTLTASTIAADVTAPTISATNIISITSGGATILATVNESARSGVTWGYTTATTSGTATNGATLSTSPSVAFSGATPTTLVYVRFWASDVSGNTNSVLASFTTLAAPPGGLGRTFYVDQTAGNDNNTGLSGSPWKNCPGMKGTSEYTGNGTLVAGDTVYLDMADTWPVSSAGVSQSSFTLVGGVKYIGNVWGTGTRAKIRANGRCESGIVRMRNDDAINPTWFKGFEVDGAVTNTATGIDLNHGYWSVGVTGADKLIADNWVHSLYSDSGVGDYTYGIIVSDNSPDASGYVANFTISNNVVTGAARDFVALYPGADGMISNGLVTMNYISGVSTDPSYSEGHGITVKGNVKNCTIEFNTITNMNSSAVFFNGPESGLGNGPTNAVLRRNILQTLDNNGTVRFYGTGIMKADIYDNIFLTNSNTGAINFDGLTGTAIANIYNNTFINTFVTIGNPTTATIYFSNNIIHAVSATPLTDASTKITSHSNNVFYRTGTGTGLVVRGGTTYTSGSLTTYEASALSSDPQFSNPANLPVGFVGGVPSPSGLSLSAASPAIDSGGAISGGNGLSINGYARPQGAAWDRGAYEFTTTSFPVTGPPLTFKVFLNR